MFKAALQMPLSRAMLPKHECHTESRTCGKVFKRLICCYLTLCSILFEFNFRMTVSLRGGVEDSIP